MAERHRSQDGTRETEEFTQDDTPGQQGRDGGQLARKVGTRDLLRQATEGDVTTRVRKSDKAEDDDGTS
ncbi:MAG: hypothetical protein AAGF60_09035 [Pseudomonadota bacterium]